MAAGTEATDAVNLAQLEDATASNRYFQATGDDDDPGDDVGAYAEGAYATASGEATNAFGQGASAYGSGAYADGQHATASGFNATATADSATAVGGSLYYEDPTTGEVLLDQTTPPRGGPSASGGRAGQRCSNRDRRAATPTARRPGLRLQQHGLDTARAPSAPSARRPAASTAVGYGSVASGDYGLAVGGIADYGDLPTDLIDLQVTEALRCGLRDSGSAWQPAWRDVGGDAGRGDRRPVDALGTAYAIADGASALAAAAGQRRRLDRGRFRLAPPRHQRRPALARRPTAPPRCRRATWAPNARSPTWRRAPRRRTR